ncbi:unnamed protein product, partial [Ascophyllum nodosum]
TLPSCLWTRRVFPSLPDTHITRFYRDASLTLLQLVSRWLNFTFSRFHAFRYLVLFNSQNKNYVSHKNRTHDFRTTKCTR